MNRLLSKRMSNIYFKVTIETFSKLLFSGFKNITQFSNSLMKLRNPRSWSKTVWLFYYFNFERNNNVFKVKESMHFVEQKYKL